MAVVKGADFKVEGLDELEKQFERVGKIPKKYLSRAARLGSDKPLKEAKRDAPEGETKLLKKGIYRKMETPNKKLKSIYRIRWNPKYTEHYKKPTTGVYGGKTPDAYYPHSVEYGFKTKYGKTKGKYFARDAVERNVNDSLQKVITSLNGSITELLKAKG